MKKYQLLIHVNINNLEYQYGRVGFKILCGMRDPVLFRSVCATYLIHGDVTSLDAIAWCAHRILARKITKRFPAIFQAMTTAYFPLGEFATCSGRTFSPANFNQSRCRILVFASRRANKVAKWKIGLPRSKYRLVKFAHFVGTFCLLRGKNHHFRATFA